MKSWHCLLLLLVAGIMSISSVERLYDMHAGESKTKISRLIYYPDILVKIMSLEFPGAVADYLMLNTMVLHGEKMLAKTVVEPDEWQATYRALEMITVLDPRFIDPYILAETSLPWDAGMVEETNRLLVKAASVLTEDYRPYFFLWFNYSYFLQDNETAVAYLEKAARIPGAPSYFTTLAARMRFEAGSTLSGIVFLQEMLNNTMDAGTRAFLQKRLDALRAIAFLEKKVMDYRALYQKLPENLAQLVSRGLIESLPEDPYGGEFYIMQNGRIYTTSKLVQTKKN